MVVTSNYTTELHPYAILIKSLEKLVEVELQNAVEVKTEVEVAHEVEVANEVEVQIKLKLN